MPTVTCRCSEFLLSSYNRHNSNIGAFNVTELVFVEHARCVRIGYVVIPADLNNYVEYCAMSRSRAESMHMSIPEFHNRLYAFSPNGDSRILSFKTVL
jgi:hypothetical protein